MLLASLSDTLNRVTDDHSAVTRLLLAAAVIIGAVILIRVLNRAVSRTYWRRATSIDQLQELDRQKRQQTVVTLVQSLIRYTIFGVAFFFALGLIFRGLPSAIFGASMAVIIVGFAFQRLGGDVIAGILLIFENQFGVGDVVSFVPHNLEGVVEEVGIRTTVVRLDDGSRAVVLNGTITGLVRRETLRVTAGTASDV